MRTYFPFFRGKQNELMAVRDLAPRIAESGNVVPIIEPVKGNATTRKSIDKYIEVSMPFVLVCNPLHGDFKGRPESLFKSLISERLGEYDGWTPAFQVDRGTSHNELSAFLGRYSRYEVAIIYQGVPTKTAARTLLRSDRITRHVFLDHRAEMKYVTGIPKTRRVMVSDAFARRARNADYPEREFFTDMNTPTGNPSGLSFGDFSIVGDHYSEKGGPAYAVAIHHVHFQNSEGALDISHFISDRTKTAVDTPGKIMEAVVKLVDALDQLLPSDTQACHGYRHMVQLGVTKGLGYMKRLAIKHHLEVMLGKGIRL